MSSRGAITLSQHLLAEEQNHSLPAELSKILIQIGFASKVLAREFARAALVGKLGLIGEKNATGDYQKKLDVYANDAVVSIFAESGLVAGIVSEELEKEKEIESGSSSEYLMCIDPLDGSSNTDINGALGTIFGIRKRPAKNSGSIAEDVLRPGSEQVAAGYVMYSNSTLLVYTAGHGAHGFTLDRELGEFILTHENLRCPPRGHYYSANLGKFYDWSHELRKYIEYLTAKDPATKRPYSLRYSGALVADLHRSLIEGGIYFYPPDADHSGGKLRLMYECAPLAMVVEQAGGSASTGERRILEVKPQSIHQQIPFVIGSAADVALYEHFLSGQRVAAGQS
jgi:fructose-1,6-bisphosphatase I